MSKKASSFTFNRCQVNIVLIIILVSCIIWWVYNRFIRPHGHFLGKTIYDPPQWFKCLIPNISNNPNKNKCEKVNVDGWTVMHIVMYFFLGMVIPGKYLFILILSIVCELFEYYSGWRARWFIDPIANVFGYWLGSLLAAHVNWKLVCKLVGGPLWTWTTLPLIVILLILNRPAFMPDPNAYL